METTAGFTFTQVVPLKDMTLEELALHDGSKDPSRPLCLAIQVREVHGDPLPTMLSYWS
jgi:hypothetical protein